MPRKVMQHLRILTHQLTATQPTIYDFNTSGTRSMNKIKLKCQIGDLQPKVMCYVIDADISYNLLLGYPWIHHNFIIPSTIPHVMKYADEEGEIKTLKLDPDSKASIQKGQKLLYGLPPLSRLSKN